MNAQQTTAPIGVDVVKSDVIPAMVQRIVERFQPLRVILFGSYARGEAKLHSDVDLLVVFSEIAAEHPKAVEIRRALSDFPVAKDVVLTTPEEIARRGHLIGTVLRPALLEGRVIYDRVPQNVLEAQNWLRLADEDLTAARTMLDQPPFPPRHACWLAQQAAEKAIKAGLIFLQIPFPFIHDLETLRALLPADWGARNEATDLDDLSDWAVAARYPGRRAEATRADATRAVAQAGTIVGLIRLDLSTRGVLPPIQP